MTLIPTDTDLLLRLQQGEEPAFALLYKRYASLLMHYTAARLPREEAEEIVQEVFVSLWLRRAEMHEGIDIRPYLFASVKYMIIRHLSREKVKQKYADHFRLFETVYEALPEDERDEQQLRLRIQQGLDQLPERCREVVRLRLFENLSNTEIAARMNIGKATVENYVVKGMKTLRGRKYQLTIDN